jgi:hypothetical protein
MRRLLRILLNAATVLSLVLCVATVVLWVRSYSAVHGVQRVDGMSICGAEVSRGELGVWLFRRFNPRIGQSSGEIVPEWTWSCGGSYYAVEALTFIPDAHPPVAGFSFGRIVVKDAASQTVIFAPIPFVVAMFAVLPLATVALRVRRRRLRTARRVMCLCPGCGYDCRATPDGCPECGTAMLQTKQLRPPLD